MDPLDTGLNAIQDIIIIAGHHLRPGRERHGERAIKDNSLPFRNRLRDRHIRCKQSMTHIPLIDQGTCHHPQFYGPPPRLRSFRTPQRRNKMFQSRLSCLLNQGLLIKDLVQIKFERSLYLWVDQYLPERRDGLQETVVPSIFTINAKHSPNGFIVRNTEIFFCTRQYNMVKDSLSIYFGKKIYVKMRKWICPGIHLPQVVFDNPVEPVVGNRYGQEAGRFIIGPDNPACLLKGNCVIQASEPIYCFILFVLYPDLDRVVKPVFLLFLSNMLQIPEYMVTIWQ